MKLVSEESEEDNKNSKKKKLIRRIRIDDSGRLRTASERIRKLEITDELISPIALQSKHDDAFDVEQVTDEFFKDFSALFRSLKENLIVQNNDRKWAHSFTLQFLNRLMFIYFIQKKRWLGNDPEFVETYWKAYKKADQKKDTFASKWLG